MASKSASSYSININFVIVNCVDFASNTYSVNFHNSGISTVIKGPISGGVVALKTEKREVSGSNFGRACRPSCSGFSVVFSETRVNTG